MPCRQTSRCVERYRGSHISGIKALTPGDLDIRAFPLSAKGSDRSDLEERCLESLSKMDSLHSLAWTRDKSLTPELVQQISRHKRLRSLEIAGHAEHSYDPALIGHMDSLEELRVMMPDALWRHTLPEVAKRLADRDCGGLRALALICRVRVAREMLGREIQY